MTSTTVVWGSVFVVVVFYKTEMLGAIVQLGT